MSGPGVRPPPRRKVPLYRRGRVWTLVAGLVVLGVYLFNSGVFNAPIAEQFLAGWGERTQTWGISESSWDCIEEGLRADGHVADLAEMDDSQFEALDRLGPDAPITEVPPAFQNFIEEFVLYLDPAAGCLSPSEFDAVQAFSRTNIADAPTVAAAELLMAGCRQGSLADCDMLSFIPVISEAENTVLTCGDLNDPLDFEFTTCVLHHQSDTDYQHLVDLCGTGFYLACDVLRYISDPGSGDGALAASCGGARDSETVIPCWADYGFGTRD